MMKVIENMYEVGTEGVLQNGSCDEGLKDIVPVLPGTLSDGRQYVKTYNEITSLMGT